MSACHAHENFLYGLKAGPMHSLMAGRRPTPNVRSSLGEWVQMLSHCLRGRVVGAEHPLVVG